jgi:hypothetical protein
MKISLPTLAMMGLLSLNPPAQAQTPNKGTLEKRIEAREDSLLTSSDKGLKTRLSNDLTLYQKNYPDFSNPQDQLEVMDRAVALDPSNRLALSHRAELYWVLARSHSLSQDKAQELLLKALNDDYKVFILAPDNPESYRHLAQTYVEQSIFYAKNKDEIREKECLVNALSCYQKIEDLLKDIDPDSLLYHYPKGLQPEGLKAGDERITNLIVMSDVHYQLKEYEAYLKDFERFPDGFKDIYSAQYVSALLNSGKENEATEALRNYQEKGTIQRENTLESFRIK